MFFDFSHEKSVFDEVHVIGAGTLGGSLAYLLAKKRIAKTLHVYDADVVEEKNVSNQIYDPADVGKKKVEVLKDKLKGYVEVRAYDYVITPYNVSSLDGVVLDTTDSLDVLKLVVRANAELMGFIKIRGTNAMFGIITQRKKEKLYEIVKNKIESYEMSTIPVRFESSMVACAMLLHILAYSKRYDKIFFADFSKIVCAVDYIRL